MYIIKWTQNHFKSEMLWWAWCSSAAKANCGEIATMAIKHACKIICVNLCNLWFNLFFNHRLRRLTQIKILVADAPRCGKKNFIFKNTYTIRPVEDLSGFLTLFTSSSTRESALRKASSLSLSIFFAISSFSFVRVDFASA